MTLWDAEDPFFARERQAMMSCEKSAPILYYHGSKTELIERLSPDVLKRALIGSDETAKRSEILGKIPEEWRITQAVFNHELDHLRRQFGTSAGLLQWAGASCLTAYAGYLLETLLRLGLTIDRNLMDVAMKQLGSRADLKFASTAMVLDRLAEGDRLESIYLSVAAVSEFLRSVEGEFRSLTGIEGLYLAEAGLILLNTWVEGKGAYSLSAGVSFEHEQSWDVGGPWIGAKHLFEGFAIQEEADSLARLGCAATPYARVLTGQLEYRLLLMAWHGRFPNLDCTRTGNVRKGDKILETWRILPVEAYAAADLALWMPFGSTGIVSRNRHLQWNDVHPGWRFSAAMSALAEIGFEGVGVGADDRCEVFVSTQKRICDHLDWPYPDRLAEDWQGHFVSGSWSVRGLMLGNDRTPAVKIAQRVLEVRRNRPFDCVVNNVDWNDVDLHFPLWMTMENRRRQMHRMAATAEADEAYAATLQWHALKRMLFGKKAGGVFDNLVPEQQVEAARLLCGFLESADVGLVNASVARAFSACTGTVL